MADRNGRPLVVARLSAYYLPRVPQEKLLLSERVGNCSLVINAYFSQQYYMPFAICD